MHSYSRTNANKLHPRTKIYTFQPPCDLKFQPPCDLQPPCIRETWFARDGVVIYCLNICHILPINTYAVYIKLFLCGYGCLTVN